jgi:hypothetical protein
MRVINPRFPLIVLASLATPALLGGLLTMSPHGAFTGLIWGGFPCIFVQHHVTWSVNSVRRFVGRRRFDVEDQSTNVFWLALRRSARAGTTTTTRSRGRQRTACAGRSWIPRRCSSARCGAYTSPGMSSRSRPSASRRSSRRRPPGRRLAEPA